MQIINEINWSNVPKNTPIWACAFSMDTDRKGYYGTGHVTHKHQPPVKGIVSGSQFYILKRDGTPRANGVNIHARRFTMTEKESQMLYNRMIDEKIEKLTSVIDSLRNMKQTVDDDAIINL